MRRRASRRPRAGPARKYDPARGIQFGVHADKPVLGAMLDAAAAEARYTARARKLLRVMVEALPESEPAALDDLPVVQHRELLELREAIGASILLGAAGATTADPETIAIQMEIRTALLRGLEKLTAEQQHIVRLHCSSTSHSTRLARCWACRPRSSRSGGAGDSSTPASEPRVM